MEVAQLLDSHSDWFFSEGLHFGEIESLPPVDVTADSSSLGLFDHLLESVEESDHHSIFAPHSDASSSDSSSGHDQFGTNDRSLRYPGFYPSSISTSSMLCFDQSDHVERLEVSPKQSIKTQFDPIEWLKNGCTNSDPMDSITTDLSSRAAPKNKRLPTKCLDEVRTLKRNCVRNEKNLDTVVGSKDPQSIAARNRREKISERLKILQDLVPNGSKVDMVTMLEKAISYVKFLQLQVKILATDEFWPSHGGRVPDIGQVQEAMDAIVSTHGKC